MDDAILLGMTKGIQWAQTMPAFRDRKGGKKSCSLMEANPTADSLVYLGKQWLTDLESRGYAQQTTETYKWALRAFLQWTAEQKLYTPKDLTETNMEAYRIAVYVYRKRNDEPLCINTQRTRLATVQRFCSWMYHKGLVDANPALELILPRKQARRLPKSLSHKRIHYLMRIPNVSDPLGIRNRAMLELFYTSGIRRKELVQADVEDFERTQSILRIEHGKGGEGRVVPVGRRAMEWLETYLQKCRPLLVVNKEEPALFLTGYGDRFSTGYVGNLVRKMMDEAGIPKGGACHLLRHSCATHMLEGGADIRMIQQLLGHARLDTTQIYTHVGIQALREVHRRTHPAG
jgi:integrase/recombinase XerD